MIESCRVQDRQKPFPRSVGLPGVPALLQFLNLCTTTTDARRLFVGYTVNQRGTEEQRFWRKVRINYSSTYDGNCWEWQGAISDGYGTFSLARPIYRVKGRMVKAYRWSYEYLIGQIPKTLELDHLCRNRACVNPAHMEPVTNLVNGMRGVGMGAINAMKLFCKRGHPLSGENLGIISNPKGTLWRRCRACGIAAAKRNKLKYKTKGK